MVVIGASEFRGFFIVESKKYLKVNMHPTPQKVWYKQFWPWFLIALPVISMIVSLNMLRFALNGEDSLVVDEYYKQGKAININLQKIEMAKKLNIKAQMRINDNSVELHFTDGKPGSAAALNLVFYHATQKHKDTTFTLIKDASETYRALIDTDLTGKWQVSLQPHDELWKIQQTISLPQKQSITFIP
ncbi:MAG: hypothetical protein ACI88A_003082 [Paraglaciecola sp.]